MARPAIELRCHLHLHGILNGDDRLPSVRAARAGGVSVQVDP